MAATLCMQTIMQELGGATGGQKTADMPSIEPMVGSRLLTENKQQSFGVTVKNMCHGCCDIY